ncbi:MAG: tRNA (cytidine(34)-2'-O)-methyltransferase [Puniceicoccales bacterium]|jgi:tRNA (cytidine/uridine-2'-O-)-methyltransferase|nr:tRNA (cytidine(34)-2'-O)-methyltransferase [Puniceicoccales bacterium]
MLHLILYQPQIPQNTGNIGRLCAISRSRLHLIHPLGFKITDAALRRSGMDYWHSLDVHHHADWTTFTASKTRPHGHLWLLTTKATQTIWDTNFTDDDGLVFGNEGSGSPPWLHEAIGNDHRITIPQFNPALRSLNLSTAAGIATYEALRQCTARERASAVPAVLTQSPKGAAPT